MATLSEVFSNIANAIRNKTGKTATMTPAEMVTEIGALSDTSADTVTAATMLSGTTAHDKSGTKVTGTIATKTSSNMTVSGATVTAPAGYYASAQSKSVATATQATPSISVDSAGEITASATQTAGYVSAGTKSATKQLTVQAAQTITPGTADKTIASGRYLIGTQTIKGDANLVPENIASGVSIFGVEGRLAVGEAGNTPSISVVNNTDMMLICGTTIVEPGTTGVVYDGGAISIGFLSITSTNFDDAGRRIKFFHNGVESFMQAELTCMVVDGQSGFPLGYLLLMGDGQVAIGDTIELVES